MAPSSGEGDRTAAAGIGPWRQPGAHRRPRPEPEATPPRPVYPSAPTAVGRYPSRRHARGFGLSRHKTPETYGFPAQGYAVITMHNWPSVVGASSQVIGFPRIPVERRMIMNSAQRVGLVLLLTGAVSVAAVVGTASSNHVSVAGAAPTSATDETKVPHYFGPYPNWANSPQVLANAVVTLSDPGGGTAPRRRPPSTPKTGGISAITVTSPGSGYTAAPTVTITSPGVTPTTPAAATAVISPGVVTSIAVAEAGFGFTTPSVTLTGGNPTPGFEATAVASGGVDDVTRDRRRIGVRDPADRPVLAPEPARWHAGDRHGDDGRQRRRHVGRPSSTRAPATRRRRPSTIWTGQRQPDVAGRRRGDHRHRPDRRHLRRRRATTPRRP